METIEWVAEFQKDGTQQEVNLFGVGEPTLNPRLVDMVAYARGRLMPGTKLHLNTNGNHMTEYLAGSLKNTGITSMDITMHGKQEATAKTIRIFQDLGIPFTVSADPVLHPNNWAGQVDWLEPRYPKPYPCPWVGRGQVMVMSDGRVTRCCLDALAKGVLGSVSGDLRQMEVTPFKLCKTCHHTIP